MLSVNRWLYTPAQVIYHEKYTPPESGVSIVYTRGRQPFQTSELHLNFLVPGDRHPGEFRFLGRDLFYEQKKKVLITKIYRSYTRCTLARDD